MSITRALLNEFRPFFNVDDPFLTAVDPFSVVTSPSRYNTNDGALSSGYGEFRTPRVEVNEEDNKYVVRAEIPGVRKEDLDVNIGDGGRSLKIQGGSVVSSMRQGGETRAPDEKQSRASTGGAASSQTPQNEVANHSANEVGQYQPGRSSWSSYSFSRTIWLPRPVNPANVTAKLDHGILTLDIPKREEPGTQKINIQ